MALTQFRKVKATDNELRQVQDAVAFVFQDLTSKPILDGRLIKDIAINGVKSVDHGLSRSIEGYFVIKKNANVNIWDTVSSVPQSTLILNSSGAATISIWVF